MTSLAADIRAARSAAERVLDELDLGAYVFSVEPKEGGWVLTLECAAADAWQVVSLPVDPSELRASLDDASLRRRLGAEWLSRLEGPRA